MISVGRRPGSRLCKIAHSNLTAAKDERGFSVIHECRYADLLSQREQPGWAQSHEISTSPRASSQRWLQYFLSSVTVHLQGGCAHFSSLVSAMMMITLSLAV